MFGRQRSGGVSLPFTSYRPADSRNCFSTRMTWHSGGKGELYLVSHAVHPCIRISRSTSQKTSRPNRFATPPQSVCDAPLGLSIGRGSWTFTLGAWTTIRQDVWLNTPGLERRRIQHLDRRQNHNPREQRAISRERRYLPQSAQRV